MEGDSLPGKEMVPSESTLDTEPSGDINWIDFLTTGEENIPLLWKKLVPTNRLALSLTPGPSHRWARGK